MRGKIDWVAMAMAVGILLGMFALVALGVVARGWLMSKGWNL